MTQTPWQPGPAAPALADGVVDVWRSDLADAAAHDAVRELLSLAERERATRFARVEDGRRWSAARGILRALLGAYAHRDPRTLRFAEGAHGKPALAGDPAPRLRFNLSHSGDVALCAFALDREVGIDVELPRRAVDHVAIARRILGDAEAERLQALGARERERAFLRAWVRWEAVLKCRGTGIGGAEREPAGGEDAWVQELDFDPPGAAALAVEDGPATVRCFRWPPASR